MALFEEVSVSGFEEFNRAVEQHHDKTIFAYFSGSKDAEGKSWCPDCVQAEPVVREGLKHVSEGCVFIYCQVGEKSYWKDPNNDFRQKLKITAVPTLLKYGTSCFWGPKLQLRRRIALGLLSPVLVCGASWYLGFKALEPSILMIHHKPQKLVESECLQADLVEMLFSED